MRVSRAVAVVVGGVVVLAVAAGVSAHLMLQSRAASMQQIPDPFVSLPEEKRPAKSAEPALTLLLAGVDSGLDESSTGNGGVAQIGRSDALMLVRLTADRQRAYVISLPRDSWVSIPERGNNKLNASFAFGGPALAVQTVEQLTGVRIDHVAVVDLAGFRALTDALGGVDIDVPENAYDEAQELVFPAGRNHFDGEAALRYVRQRYGLPRGDLDRVRRHQQFLRALFEQVIQQGDNPRRMASVFDAITKTITVDTGFGIGEMMQLLVDFRRLRGNVRFLTAPVQGTGQVGDASVVFLDPALSPPFWHAVASDSLESYLAGHLADELIGPPR